MHLLAHYCLSFSDQAGHLLATQLRKSIKWFMMVDAHAVQTLFPANGSPWSANSLEHSLGSGDLVRVLILFTCSRNHIGLLFDCNVRGNTLARHPARVQPLFPAALTKVKLPQNLNTSTHQSSNFSHMGVLQATNAMYFIIVGVCAPVWEEAIFRGFLLPSLGRWLPVPAAIAASACIFALAHLQGGGSASACGIATVLFW